MCSTAGGTAPETTITALAALLRPLVVAGGVGVVLWLPMIVDTLTNDLSNLGQTIAWFRDAAEGTNTLADGWWIVMDSSRRRNGWSASGLT